jgi:hypothetical protein
MLVQSARIDHINPIMRWNAIYTDVTVASI